MGTMYVVQIYILPLVQVKLVYCVTPPREFQSETVRYWQWWSSRGL